MISFLLATSDPTLTIAAPFDFAETATYVAGVAALVLGLTMGYRIGFSYVKAIIGRVAGNK